MSRRPNRRPLFARLTLGVCACLFLAACANTEAEDLAAVVEAPSTTAVELEAVDSESSNDDGVVEEEPASNNAVAAIPEVLDEEPPPASSTTAGPTTTTPATADPSTTTPSTTTATPTTTTAAVPTTTTPATSEAPRTTAAPEPAFDPNSPLNGTFSTVGGQSIDLASLQGQDVVLWFWAPW